MAHLALFVANVIFGINYSVAKGIMPEYVPPFGFIVLRVWGAVLLFWVFSGWKSAERLEPKGKLYMGLCASLLYALVLTILMAYLLNVFALRTVNASVPSIWLYSRWLSLRSYQFLSAKIS